MRSTTELLEHLRSALVAAGSPWAGAELAHLRDKGLAHDHVRLCGTGVLARIPKQSQLGLDSLANLAYQRACFERAVPSGHTPHLLGWLPPSPPLPRGALLVQEILGRPATLPADLHAVVRALAGLHRLPLPPSAARVPLLDAPDPLEALRAEIAGQAEHVPAAAVAPSVALAIAHELSRLRELSDTGTRPPRRLIAFDGHPGNFIVTDAGRAVLVDLEKCRYSYPGLDLAHATLYTSTTWDLDSQAVLSPGQVADAYAVWEDALGCAAAGARPWHVSLRRAMWLWSITWCAKWRLLSGGAAQTTTDGEDWSAERSDDALVAHVRGRVDHYLDARIVHQALDEFDALDAALAP